jgi:hypothetical protein
MKTKFKPILRRLILWAAGEDINAAEKRCAAAAEDHRLNLTTKMHQSRDHLAKENAKQWRMLDGKIAALQAMDVPFGKDLGKIVIVARVRGQDIVKIIDIPPSMDVREYKELVEELQTRYGARPVFLDAPADKRTFISEYLGMPDAATLRAAARDRGFMQ